MKTEATNNETKYLKDLPTKVRINFLFIFVILIVIFCFHFKFFIFETRWKLKLENANKKTPAITQTRRKIFKNIFQIEIKNKLHANSF